MTIFYVMAQTINESLPQFSRITSSKRMGSWAAAVPVVLILVAVIGAFGWIAMRSGAKDQVIAAAQTDAKAARDSADSLQKRATALEADNALLKSPGRTTVVLEAQASGKASRGAAKDVREQGWAAATWGESEGSKSWMKLDAYGLKPAPDGQIYRAWLQPATGAAVDLGKLDPAPDGNASVFAKDLPAIDQGKMVLVALGPAEAKASPEVVLIQATLPGLKPTMANAQGK